MGIFENTDWITAYSVNASSRVIQDTISTSSLAVTNALHQTNNNLYNIDNSLAQIYQGVDTSNDFLADIYTNLGSVNNNIITAVKILEEISKNISSPDEVKANEYYRLARSNIQAALRISGNRAEELIGEAKVLCLKAVEKFDYNYSAHFDIGWIYHTIENKPEKAVKYFERAITTSISRDLNFAILSFRNLFQVYLSLGEYKKANETINEAYSLVKDNLRDPELLHDLAFSHRIQREYDSLESTLNYLIKRWPVYFKIVKSGTIIPRDKSNDFFNKFLDGERDVLMGNARSSISNIGWEDESYADKSLLIVERLAHFETSKVIAINDYQTLISEIDDFSDWTKKQYMNKEKYDRLLSGFQEKVMNARELLLISEKDEKELLSKAPFFPL